MADRTCSNTFASLNNAVNGSTGAHSSPGPFSQKADNESTITIQAGSAANWSATEQLFIDNYIYIKGQGMGNTTINSPWPSNDGAIKWFINASQYPQSPSGPTPFQWGLQGFTFNYTGNQTALNIEGNCSTIPSPASGPPGYNGFYVLGTSSNFRCTDVKWYTTGGILIRWNDIIGLVDHCYFDFLGQWGLVYDTKWGYPGYSSANPEPYSHGSYELPVKWGTAENLYFEDCFMNYRSTNPAGGGCDSHEAGRYVVRHCRFNNGSKPTNHGTESHTHGCRAQEVYQNWFDTVSGSIGEHRSGTMICHDNVVQGPTSAGVTTYSLQNHRNFARKLQGSCRGDNPTYMTDSREAVRYMLVNANASIGATSLAVTVPNSLGNPPNGSQQEKRPFAGATFQVKGETPKNTLHTITGWTIPPLPASQLIPTAIQFTTTPLLSNITNGAAISFMYPSCDQNTPLANDNPLPESNVMTAGTLTPATTTVPSSSNEPRNGNVSPDVYTGTAEFMGEKTTLFTAQTGFGAGWIDNQFKTENDDKSLNKGFNYEVVNTDEPQMGSGMVTTATSGPNIGKANHHGNQIQISIAGVSGWPLGFAAGQNYAIRRVYAGADQPGMGVIDPIIRPTPPNTDPKLWPTSNTNAQTGTVAAPGNANSPPGTGRKIGWPNQKRDPNYNWNCFVNPDPNIALGSAGSNNQIHFDTEQGIFILGRDFFEQQKPAPGASGVDPAISPGYPIDTSAPATSVKRQIGAANISTISGNSTILWQQKVQSTQQITGLVYPHPMIQPPPVIPGPSISVAPDSDAFSPPSVTVGTSADHQNMVISNLGDQPLTISSITSSSARFTIGTGTGASYVTPITFPFDIAVGQSVTKTVRFTPTAATSYSTTISFDSNDTATHDSEQAYIITGSGQTAPQGPIMSLSDSAGHATPSHGFGTVTLGQAASFALTISNTGDEDLIITSVTFPSAPNNMFTFGVGQSTSFTIAPDENTTRDIIFTPAAASSYSGSIVFVSNDPDTTLGRENFAVTGTGQGTQPPPTVHGKKKKKNVLIQRF